MSDWLIDAADLLAEPDPGPTPWLVDGLIVDQALAAVVGRWKASKSWAALELSVSVATGEAAFGTHAIPTPGPAVYVIEESGRKALWRRLDALCRGRGIDKERLRGTLQVAPNARVKLDDRRWQDELLEVGVRLQPRAFIFDPLARMKDAERPENDQSGMAPVIEYLRRLRDETGAACCFVHHTGHQGEHMRGSSDLESAWESRLSVKRDGDSGLVTITAEHRDEESGGVVSYRLAWDAETRTMRLRSSLPPLTERVLDYLAEHGPSGAETIAKGIGTRRSDVARVLAESSRAGTTHRAPSGKRDGRGRPIAAKVWHLSSQARLHPVPIDGRDGTSHPSSEASPIPRPTPLGVDGGRGTGTGAADGCSRIGDDGYLQHLFAAFENGHVTEQEWHQGERAHRLLTGGGHK